MKNEAREEIKSEREVTVRKTNSTANLDRQYSSDNDGTVANLYPDLIKSSLSSHDRAECDHFSSV